MLQGSLETHPGSPRPRCTWDASTWPRALRRRPDGLPGRSGAGPVRPRDSPGAARVRASRSATTRCSSARGTASAILTGVPVGAGSPDVVPARPARPPVQSPSDVAPPRGPAEPCPSYPDQRRRSPSRRPNPRASERHDSPMSSTPLTAVEPGSRGPAGGRGARPRAGRPIVEQIEKRVVGQREVVEHLLIALFSPRPLPLRGRARAWRRRCSSRTLAEVLNLSFNRIQFTPDLMPSDITGTDILEEDRATGRREFRFVQRPAVRQHHPRRRGEPHPAQDPGGAAPGDAGVPGHRRRADLPAGAAVPRLRHPEPHRAGGHLPAARGAARPLHVPGRRRLPDAPRRRCRSSRAPPPATQPHADARCSRRSRSSRCRSWCAGCRCRTTWCATRWSWCAHTRPKEPGAPDFVREERRLGRRAAREPVPGARGQGARHPPRAASRPRWRTCARWRGPCCATACCPTSPPRARASPRSKLSTSCSSVGEGLARRAPMAAARRRRRWPGSPGVKLRARAVVEGVLSGLHKSPHQGQSVEFAEHKEYAPGDELRHLDWKALRQVRQVLRQALRARDQPALGAGGRCVAAPWATAAAPLSKLEVATHARRRARATCWCASRTRPGSRVIAGRRASRTCRPRASAGHLNVVLDALEHAAAERRHGPLRRRGPPGRDAAAPLAGGRASPTCSTTGTTALKRHPRAARAQERRGVFHLVDPAELDVPLRRPHALPLDWRTSGASR